jgi:hypothetical protein
MVFPSLSRARPTRSTGRLDRLLTALDGDDIVLQLLHREILADTVSNFVELYRDAPPVAASDLDIRWSGDDA